MNTLDGAREVDRLVGELDTVLAQLGGLEDMRPLITGAGGAIVRRLADRLETQLIERIEELAPDP